MIRGVGLILFLIFLFYHHGFCQTSTGRILRSQEDLEKEIILREKLKRKEKNFIKKIKVEGISLLSDSQIKEIISSFQEKWLTPKDIEGIMDLLRQEYRENAGVKNPPEISYQIKGQELEIRVREDRMNPEAE